MNATPSQAGQFNRSVSIVVTAFNEDVVVEQVVRGTHAVAERLLETYELILVDDGSRDQTGAIMDRLSTELPHTRTIHNNPNVGFGASYLRGVREARHDYVMLVCGDNGLPVSNLPAIIEKIGTADIVIPYMRNLREVKTPTRYLISRTYTIFLNLISGFHLQYYNGLSVHRRNLLDKLEVRSTGFGFQGEILVKLLKSGHSYVEVAVDAASKEQQRSGFLRLRNIVNVVRTCVNLVRDLRKFDGTRRERTFDAENKREAP